VSLGLVLAAALAASAAPDAPRHEAVVVVAVENMYSAPDEDKDVVSQATLGQVVTILETKEAFSRVETPDRYPGWIRRAALAEYTDGSAPRYATQGPVVEVASLMANVYREPDVTTARPRIQAPLATRLEVSGRGPGERWIAVRLPGGDTGYIQSGDVKPADPAAKHPRGDGAALVATARRFLGVPYLWGGMTAHGVDCSGFVSRVYHANGIEIPRDADLQFDDPGALPVERDHLQAGDLVFFGRDAKHITHVGLYLADGHFISATTYQVPVVREDRLDDPHWSAIYQGARRPR
jgi:cell wall-associated NlpC family hydrolase